MPLLAQMNKLPLVNPRFDRRSNENPKLIPNGPKNPNFDLAVKTGLNQHYCEDYQILIPTTIHESKLELEQLRYHKNRDNAPINAPLTSESHNL